MGVMPEALRETVEQHGNRCASCGASSAYTGACIMAVEMAVDENMRPDQCPLVMHTRLRCGMCRSIAKFVVRFPAEAEPMVIMRAILGAIKVGGHHG